MIEEIEKIKKLARGINTKEILQEKEGTCLISRLTSRAKIQLVDID